MFIIGKVCENHSEKHLLIVDFSLAIEIAICIILGIGLIVVLIVCKRIDQGKSNNDEERKIELLSTSINEGLLLQNTLITYYEQQRNELIERQKMVLDDLKVETTVIKNNDSDYASKHLQSHSPHSLYECTGFASMDNLEVSNPLFSTNVFHDNGQVSATLSLITK